MRITLPLLVLLLCAFVVNVDTTLVNVALPTLSEELSASTRELQWVVDAYTLLFAALVLAAGALGDRFGRKRLLLVGLVIYGVGNAAAAMASNTDALIASRALMGVGAAVIFPATLSTIVALFPDRGERAAAIGLWGATTGLAVALGPIVGGALLEASGWPATFWLKVPVVLLALALTVRFVPQTGDPTTPPVDRTGLALSTAAVLALVYTIIEAPVEGWLSSHSIVGYVVTMALVAAFMVVESRKRDPLLDLRLFRDARFSAASAAITVAFFALFGFIFLITQYFQLLRDYGALETGVRLLPVALSIGAASVFGTTLALRIGNKVIVAMGLMLMAIMFGWTSQVGPDTSYFIIAAQMLLLGTGIGLTTAPATEALMGAVPAEKAGVGSGVNDTTRELGGTLGVAVIGSVFASLFAGAFDKVPGLPSEATDSMAGALIYAQQTGDAGVAALASAGFYDGLQAGCLVASGVCLLGAAMAWLLLPARPPGEVGVDATFPATAAATTA